MLLALAHLGRGCAAMTLVRVTPTVRKESVSKPSLMESPVPGPKSAREYPYLAKKGSVNAVRAKKEILVKTILRVSLKVVFAIKALVVLQPLYISATPAALDQCSVIQRRCASIACVFQGPKMESLAKIIVFASCPQLVRKVFAHFLP